MADSRTHFSIAAILNMKITIKHEHVYRELPSMSLDASLLTQKLENYSFLKKLSFFDGGEDAANKLHNFLSIEYFETLSLNHIIFIIWLTVINQ